MIPLDIILDPRYIACMSHMKSMMNTAAMMPSMMMSMMCMMSANSSGSFGMRLSMR